MTWEEGSKGRDRERALRDTGYMCRSYLGWNWDKDPNTGKKFNIGKGGVRADGPHQTMVEFIDKQLPRWKHMEAPRDSLKTTELLGFCVRQICADPNVRVLWGSATDEKAVECTGAIREHLEQNEALIEDFGPFEPPRGSKGRKWQVDAFTISGRTDIGIKDPTVTATSVERNSVGGHYDIVVLDDVVTWLNSGTETMLKKLRQFFNMVLPLVDVGGILIVNGTRYHDDDLSGHILRNMRDDFDVLVLDCGCFPVRGEDGLWYLEGEPTFPHLSKDYLVKRLRGMGPRDFNSQYNNKITGSDIALFHRKQFLQIHSEPWMKGMRAYQITDTATTAEDEGCFSVTGIVGIDSQERAYLFDLRVGHWLPDQVVQEVLNMNQQWDNYLDITGICMEKGALNKIFRSNIEAEARRRQMAIRFIEMPRGRGDQSKIQRITSLSSRFSRGDFVVMESVPREYQDLGETKLLFAVDEHRDTDGQLLPDGELVKQFVRFPVYGNRDIADAIADIDMVDKDGRRLCPGGMGRAAKFSQPYEGPFIQQRINGELRPVAMVPTSHSGGKQTLWSRLAQRVPGSTRRF